MSRWLAVGPIYNFNLLCNELKFPNFVVRRYTDRELREIIGSGIDHWTDFEFDCCKSWPWFLMEYEEDLPSEWSTSATEFEHFLDAVALFKIPHTCLRIGHFYVRKLEGVGASGHFGGSLVPSVIPAYVLDEHECKEFTVFYNNYRVFLREVANNKQNKRIMFALNFYRKARQIYDLNERLVFLSISLEALFSKERDELKYRYSHRVASLIGNIPELRADVFKIMRFFYNRRSQLLHGNIDFKLYEFELLVYFEVIRISILKVISLYQQGRRNIIDVLDEVIETFNEEERERLLDEANNYFGVKSDFSLEELQIAEMIGLCGVKNTALIISSGITSMQELLKNEPKKLYEKLRETNIKKSLINQHPNLDQIKRWLSRDMH